MIIPERAPRELEVARSYNAIPIGPSAMKALHACLSTRDSTEMRLRSNGHAKPYDTRMIPHHYCPTKFWLYSAGSLSATYLPYYRPRWRSKS
jgi:hypothetical protein